MGSLGSKTVNDKMVEFVYGFRNKNYEVLFVTGNSYMIKLRQEDFLIM